jgi:hypothetical protein
VRSMPLSLAGVGSGERATRAGKSQPAKAYEFSWWSANLKAYAKRSLTKWTADSASGSTRLDNSSDSLEGFFQLWILRVGR